MNELRRVCNGIHIAEIATAYIGIGVVTGMIGIGVNSEDIKKGGIALIEVGVACLAIRVAKSAISCLLCLKIEMSSFWNGAKNVFIGRNIREIATLEECLEQGSARELEDLRTVNRTLQEGVRTLSEENTALQSSAEKQGEILEEMSAQTGELNLNLERIRTEKNQRNEESALLDEAIERNQHLVTENRQMTTQMLIALSNSTTPDISRNLATLDEIESKLAMIEELMNEMYGPVESLTAAQGSPPPCENIP